MDMASKYQKRHYEDVARILRPLMAAETECDSCLDHECDGYNCLCDCHVGDHVVQEFTYLFADDNPLFKKQRFLKACGLED